MDNFKTPLRYPGGKGVLYKFFSIFLRYNNLVDGFYIEPFCGGAGLAIELLLREYVQHVYINDADTHIFAFWHSLLNESEALIRLIEDVEVSIKEWRFQKEIYENPDRHTSLEIGFATFFLNRCNRSGILGARPIGGLNQTGQWKIDARFNKKNLIHRIETIMFYADRIHVYGNDAQYFLKDILKNLPQENTFIYLDPPYYLMGGELYLNNYNHSDHQSLSYFLKDLPFNWVLSYDNVPQIVDMYRDKRSLNVNLHYRANGLKQGKELMFFSDDLNIPNIEKDIINI